MEKEEINPTYPLFFIFPHYPCPKKVTKEWKEGTEWEKYSWFLAMLRFNNDASASNLRF